MATCTLQVRAGNLSPVTALVQNLLMSALFQPFEALCSAANAEVVKVGHPTLQRPLLTPGVAYDAPAQSVSACFCAGG